MTVLRFFKDELTGDECAIAWNEEIGDEICITASQAHSIINEPIEEDIDNPFGDVFEY